MSSSKKTYEELHEHGAGRVKVSMGSAHHHVLPRLLKKERRTRRLPKVKRPMRFRSLHHHSTYSYLDGFQLPEAHVRRATELNMDALALTEHGNVSSHVKLESACVAQGVKPIFGVELYTGHLDEERRTQRKNHLTILAENQRGYSNLLKLVGKTYSEGFYYEPTADGRMLRQHRSGLIVLSGCQGSLLFTSLVGGKNIPDDAASYERGKRVAARFARTFRDAYYLEVQAFPELDKTNQANPLIAQISRELGIPMVASLDCHYTLPTEKEVQQVLHNIRPGKNQTLEEQVRDWGYTCDLCPPLSDNIVIRKLIATGLTKKEAIAAVMATEEISQRCNVKIPSLPMLRYPLPSGCASSRDLWRQWLREGWEYRGMERLSDRERRKYQKRLKYEMRIIEEKSFVDYFLFVADAVRWAKDHGIAVGPARGSAAASLACWLLRITEVNPMLYPNLVFERFIDISRADLPDIDLDFHSERRQEVTQYLASKYGRESVNNIGTFSTFKSKLALDDVARVYRIPKFEVDKVKDVLIERSSGDLRASATVEDTVEQFPIAREVFEKYPDLVTAMKLEGNVKAFGVHAAGLVLSNGPVTDVCAVYERRVNDTVYKVLALDKYDAERKNLLKLDFLGLNTMTLLDEARKELGMTLDEFYNIPLDDKETIRGFQENDVVGVFQFDGRACRYVSGALRPDSFKEVCDTTALARPGPLHNGAANAYVDVKRQRAKPETIHPSLAKITADTYGQVVYQEQILRIVREIGDFDWTHASYIRRIISRKIGEQAFNKEWDRFWGGAQRLHPDMTEEEAKAIWGLCITAGAYAFNAAHTVAYGLISWWCMWLKRHHRAVFYKNALCYLTDQKHQSLLRDAAQPGRRTRKPIRILPPTPDTSTTDWQRISRGSIQAGFSQIPGLGMKTATAIVEHRQQSGLKTWSDLLEIKGIGAKTVQKIEEFVNQDDPYRAHWLDRAIAKVKEAIANADEGFEDLPDPTHTASDLPYTRGQDIEVVWLGAVYTRNVRDIFEWNRAKTGVELDRDSVRDPHLNEYCIMVGDDETDQMGLRINRWRYPRYRDLIWKMRPGQDLMLVRGVKPGWQPTRQIDISDMWLIDPEV
jgi:DNA polymerase-3 subunit alpha